MRLISTLLLVLLLTGCYSATPVKEMITDIKNYQPPYPPKENKGLVYVIRPTTLYLPFRYFVYLDSKESNAEIGYNRGGQYIYLYVEPGKHTIASKAENWGEVSFDIKAGETLYIAQDARFGFFFGRNNIYKLNPVEAQYYIKHGNIGTLYQATK